MSMRRKDVKSTFKIARTDVLRAVEEIVEFGKKSAVVFVGFRKSLPKGRIKATRRGGDANTIVLTIDRPNYAERKFAKRHIKAFGVCPKVWAR